jgi:type I restriction enzyme M protein
MLNREVKKRIDDIHDLLVGKLPLPSERLELITISLIYKFMDDMDERSTKIGGNRSYFKGGLLKYSWRKIVAYKPKSQENAADLLVTNFNKAINAISEAPDIPEFFQSIFRNSSVTLKDGRILKAFMDEISSFEYSNSEELGNAYEYMLLTFGNQKDIGAFRTPRHIIDFIVEIVQPHKSDKILDPACGTSGFLISAWNYIRRSNTSSQNMDNPEHWGDTLSTEENTLLASQIQGYDNTPLMVRLSKVNMFLHKIKDPQVNEYDTISSERRWNEKFDCILANPPFMTPKGGVKPHNKFKIKARKSELLFCDYIMEHLKPGGKAGFIVPEGIITNSSNNHFIEFRKWAVNEMGLWAVVSLPTGVFQPYAGVKTSILFFDRSMARTSKSIMLLKIDNDGYSLNTARGEVLGSDLPSATKLLLAFKHTHSSEQNDLKFKKSLDIIKTKFQYSIVPREDFAKIDPYRATSTAWDICRKSLKNLDKAFTTFNESVKSTSLQLGRQFEILIKAFEVFTNQTGYSLPEIKKNKIASKQWEKKMIVPLDEALLKLYFDKEIKEQVILYGQQSPISGKIIANNLSSSIIDALESKREYVLNIDRNKGIVIESNYPLLRVEDLCLKIISGGTPPTAVKEYWNGKIPWISSADILGIDKISPRKFISEKALNESAANLLPKGNLIVVTRVGLGKLALNYSDICFSQDSMGLIINKELIIPEFLAYTLQKEVQKFKTSSRGATIQGVTKNQLTELFIPIPPLNIQQQFVDVLICYQKVIDGCCAIIENFIPVFNFKPEWPLVKLNDICSKISDGTHLKPNYTISGYKFLSAKNVVGKVIDWVDTKYIDEWQHIQLSKRVKPQRNDILLAKNGTTGVAAIVDSDEEFDIYVSLALLRANQLVIPKFLLYMLNSEYVKRQFNSRLKGVGVPNLHLIEIKDIDIPLPPIEEQNEIIKELEPQFEFLVQAFQIKNKMELKIKQIVSSLWNKE